MMNRLCPHCGSAKFYEMRARRRFRCAAPSCRRDFSLTSNTALHARKMPIEKYETAMEAFKQGRSALEVSALIGCAYKTAWRLRHVFVQVVHGHP